jgi:hypothetical protein
MRTSTLLILSKLPPLFGPPNLLANPQSLGAAVWDNATPNLATVSGTTVTAATGGTGSMRRQALTAAGLTSYKLTFVLKAGTAAQTRIQMRDNTNGVDFLRALVNWSGAVPVISATSLVGSWTIKQAGADKYRVSAVGTTGVGATVESLVSLYPDFAAGTGSVICEGIDLRRF